VARLASNRLHGAGAATDRLVLSRRLFASFGAGGDRLTAVRQPLRFEGFDTPTARAWPMLGADTDHVLSETGYTDDEIAVLRTAGTAGPAVPA
jgi:crotonobetainyl-CoA:carnitine CoA-transferase CaiB-like acyl-CoA transferase